MKVVVRARVDDDLEGIFAWIAKDNPNAAANMIRRLRERIDRLAHPVLAEMGRSGREPGTRELVEKPYIIVYEVHRERNEIEILAIFHGARNR